jgi:hypothetical protein
MCHSLLNYEDPGGETTSPEKLQWTQTTTTSADPIVKGSRDPFRTVHAERPIALDLTSGRFVLAVNRRKLSRSPPWMLSRR